MMDALADEPDPDAGAVGRIACFVVARASRRTGVAWGLLDAACAALKSQGLRIAGASPKREVSGDAESHHGLFSMFSRAGFNLLRSGEHGCVYVRKRLAQAAFNHRVRCLPTPSQAQRQDAVQQARAAVRPVGRIAALSPCWQRPHRSNPGRHQRTEACMCRNIRTLFNFEPPATELEIRDASLQFVRKLSGLHVPSKANEAAFSRAVEQVASSARELIASLVTSAEPRNREVEAAKARRRSSERFGTSA